MAFHFMFYATFKDMLSAAVPVSGGGNGAAHNGAPHNGAPHNDIGNGVSCRSSGRGGDAPSNSIGNGGGTEGTKRGGGHGGGDAAFHGTGDSSGDASAARGDSHSGGASAARGEGHSRGAATEAGPSSSAHRLALLSTSAAALAGLCSSTLTFPLDKVRRIMQVAGSGGGAGGGGGGGWPAGMGSRIGWIATMAAIARRGGLRAFYDGITAEYLKVVPVSGLYSQFGTCHARVLCRDYHSVPLKEEVTMSGLLY